MLIIYGTKDFKRVKGRSTKYIHCQNCGMDSQWQLTNVWTWFTLYYIPLFPVWKKKMLFCPSCSCGIKIGKKNQELLDDVVLSSSQKKGISAGPAPEQPGSIQTVGIERQAEISEK